MQDKSTTKQKLINFTKRGEVQIFEIYTDIPKLCARRNQGQIKFM